jgi:hypothetical protein
MNSSHHKPDEPLETYLHRLLTNPGYAGADTFLSHTTWIPTPYNEIYKLADSMSMKPLLVTVLGQIRSLTLDSFLDQTDAGLRDIQSCPLQITIVDPWLYDENVHIDFIRAIKNLCLLCDSLDQPLTSSLNIDHLYKDILEFTYPVPAKQVTHLLIYFVFSIMADECHRSLITYWHPI